MNLSSDAWAVVGVAITSVSGTIAAVWVAHVKAAKQTRDVEKQVEHVRELAAPTGNGYADKTTSSLDRIERALHDLSERHVRTNAWLVEHLSDHAAADVRRDDPNHH